MPSGPPYDPDEPVAGCYRVRLVRDGPPCGLLIWFGAPVDPETGELLDRSPIWMARLNNNVPVEAARYWPQCAREPISYSEYRHIVRRSATTDPSDPYFDPMKPVDFSTAPPPF